MVEVPWLDCEVKVWCVLLNVGDKLLSWVFVGVVGSAEWIPPSEPTVSNVLVCFWTTTVVIFERRVISLVVDVSLVLEISFVVVSAADDSSEVWSLPEVVKSYLTLVSIVVDDILFIFDVPCVISGVDECMSTTEQLDFSIKPYNVQCKSHYYCYDLLYPVHIFILCI